MQTAVDGAYALIVTHEVVNGTGENRQLQPMGEASRDALPAEPLEVLADAGYSNDTHAVALEAQGVVPHVPASWALNNQGDRLLFDRREFTFDSASDKYRCPVEHPFAGLKHRTFGHPRFLMRGIAGAKAERAIATLEPEAGNERAGRGRIEPAAGSGLRNNTKEKGTPRAGRSFVRLAARVSTQAVMPAFFISATSR